MDETESVADVFMARATESERASSEKNEQGIAKDVDDGGMDSETVKPGYTARRHHFAAYAAEMTHFSPNPILRLGRDDPSSFV